MHELWTLMGSPFISTLLLSGALILAVIELFFRTHRLAGIGAFALFVLYVIGQCTQEGSNLGSGMIFVCGLLLLGAEAAIPGFGVPGILGILCIFVGTGSGGGDWQLRLLSVGISVLIVSVFAFTLIRMGYRSRFGRCVVLNTKLNEGSGFVAKKNPNPNIGDVGTTYTILRPVGQIVIDGVRYEAVTAGEFIEKDQEVEIVQRNNAQLVVRRKK